MLEKINRKSFQFQKKDDSIDETNDPKHKNMSKSKFSRIPNDHQAEENKLKEVYQELYKPIASNLLNTEKKVDLEAEELKISTHNENGFIGPKSITAFSKKTQYIDESQDIYAAEPFIESNRTRSRSNIVSSQKSSKLTEKLSQIQLNKAIIELQKPNIEEIKKENLFLTSPTLNLASPTIKNASVLKGVNVSHLRSQIKFLNNAVLTFTLIIEFVQKLTDENKLPHNVRFWFNEQKSNLEFLIGKLLENELSEEYMQKGDDIKKFNGNLMVVAQVSYFLVLFHLSFEH